MAAQRKDKPGIIVRKIAGKLTPVHAFDAERLMAMQDGAEFDVTPRSRRSSPQNRLYWQTLKRVVDATQIAPTPEALHEALKMACGIVIAVRDLRTGKPRLIPDSAAFDRLPHDEFCRYMDQAMALLSERVGFDVLEYYGEKAA